jgi:hypothetical protein
MIKTVIGKDFAITINTNNIDKICVEKIINVSWKLTFVTKTDRNFFIGDLTEDAAKWLAANFFKNSFNTFILNNTDVKFLQTCPESIKAY